MTERKMHMTDKAIINRVHQLEENFKILNQSLDKLDTAIEELDTLLPFIKEFNSYYGSQEWFKHRDLSESGMFNELPSTSILGEDYPYDTILHIKNTAINMLELSTKLLK